MADYDLVPVDHDPWEGRPKPKPVPDDQILQMLAAHQIPPLDADGMPQPMRRAPTPEQRTPMPLLTAEGVPLEDVTPGEHPEFWRNWIASHVRSR
jgi:hypothetical protein